MSSIGHNNPPQAGYILIFRTLLSHPVVGAGKPVKASIAGKPTYSRMEAWLDLLMMAVYEPETVKVNGHKYELKRGQNVCARSYLAKRWNWTDKTVRAFLLRLEKHGMINKSRAKKGQQASKLTICNYSDYQDGAQNRGQQKGQYRGQKKGQKETTLSDCNSTENHDERRCHKPKEGPVKGPIEGPQYNQDKTNKPILASLTPRLEIGGLNGSGSEILRSLARWIYLDSLEGKMDPNGLLQQPHFDIAENILRSNTDAFGAEVVKEAFAEMQTTLLSKRDVRNHAKLFIAICKQAKERGIGKKQSSARKQIQALVGDAS